jgi:5'(3')-deoxyribonucleotidase
MEEDLGLAPLSEFEKNIYLAAQALKSPDSTVKTKQLRGHSFTQSMSRPTFFRALQSLEEKKLIARSDIKKIGVFVVTAS